MNNSKNDLLVKFEEAIKSHDWFYNMADDHRYYKAGQLERVEIRKIAEEIKENGLLAEAIELWFKYAPNAPYSNTQFNFPINIEK